MGYSDLKVIEAARMIETCRDGVIHGASLADALQTARVIDAMTRSHESRAWVDVLDDGLGHGYRS